MARELRWAFRRLRRSPGFAVAAVLTLALGIGASAAVLAGVYGILLKLLPYPEAHRLVVIEHELPGFEMPGGRTATVGGQYAQLAHYRERNHSFEEIGGFVAFDAAIDDRQNPQYLRMATATAGFFRALGVQPRLGRLLDDDEPAPDEGGASVLTDGLWAQSFGRDPGILGRLLRAQGFDNEIVGVLPASLDFPPTRVSLWTSLPVSRLRDKPEWNLTLMLGRLAPGVTAEQARDELNRLIPEVPDAYPGALVRRAVVDGRLRAKVTPLRSWLVGGVERPLWLLLAAVGLVLAIACVNVTNLILVRSDARRREMAVRTAVGASGGHLVRYFLADSLVLVTTGAVVGTALAVFGVDALVRFGPSSLPRLEAVEAGRDVAVFSVLVALACVTIFAIVPWLARGRAVDGDLRESRRATAGRARLWTRHALVAFQFAMALVLLVGAGLIVRSFVALTSVDLGFEDRGVLTFRVVFPFDEIQRGGTASGGVATPFYDRLAERLAALPGVEAAGYGTCVPLADTCTQAGSSLRREDRPETKDTVPATLLLQISPGYLEALQVPLLSGRYLESRDHLQRTNAMVISAEAAHRFFPGEDPVGQRLVQEGTQWKPFTVVGVVGDVKHEDPRKAHVPFVYLPVLGDFAPFERWAVTYAVRVDGPPLALVDTIRREMGALRPDIPMAHVETQSALVARSTAQLRFALWLLAVAAVAALALSAIGAYGVMAYVVSLRRNEFGIRLALGAEGRQLRSMVLRQGAVTAAAGLLAGLGGAALAGRLLRSLIFEIGPTDLPTYVTVVCGLSATALLASYVPARRASRLDPAEILRSE
jgi:predicted permease